MHFDDLPCVEGSVDRLVLLAFTSAHRAFVVFVVASETISTVVIIDRARSISCDNSWALASDAEDRARFALLGALTAKRRLSILLGSVMRVPLISTALVVLTLPLLLGLISIMIYHFGQDTSHLHGLWRTSSARFRRLLGCWIPDLSFSVIAS